MAASAHAEGVGLFRTEFCFLDRAEAPSIDEQVTAYRGVLSAFPGRKVVVRTLDAGSDKLVVRYRRPVRGKASGIADVLDYWCVTTVRRGKLLRHEWFSSRAKALAAVGLSE